MQIGKSYSSKSILNKLENIETSGRQIGCEHTINGLYNGEQVIFIMLLNGAYRGGSSYYYKRIK
jgi:hypothetical protein